MRIGPVRIEVDLRAPVGGRSMFLELVHSGILPEGELDISPNGGGKYVRYGVGSVEFNTADKDDHGRVRSLLFGAWWKSEHNKGEPDPTIRRLAEGEAVRVPLTGTFLNALRRRKNGLILFRNRDEGVSGAIYLPTSAERFVPDPKALAMMRPGTYRAHSIRPSADGGTVTPIHRVASGENEPGPED